MQEKIKKRIEELTKILTERGQQLENIKKQGEALTNNILQMQGAMMEQQRMLKEIEIKPTTEKAKDSKT